MNGTHLTLLLKILMVRELIIKALIIFLTRRGTGRSIHGPAHLRGLRRKWDVSVAHDMSGLGSARSVR
jgi:hypothetical protein